MSQVVAHFDSLYAANADPWHVGERWYERRKLMLALSILPRLRYASAFEPACGIGQMTIELAQRCEFVLAADFSPLAVQATRARVSGLTHVDVRQLALPGEWPTRPGQGFNLVVLSEWLYYLDEPDLVSVCTQLKASVGQANADVLSCHYVPEFQDRHLATGLIHSCLEEHLGPPWAAYDDDDVSIRVWSTVGRLASMGSTS